MLVGRETELQRIVQLVESAAAGFGGALEIRGEPGIGKTRLLDEAVRAADGFHVLRAAGFESEAELPYAAVHQLLQPFLPRIDELPPPQAAALRAAFGLEHHEGTDRLLVGLAILTLLSHAAERRPLLCLVDDAHWADRESLDALAFASRRIASERIAIVVAARESEHSSAVLAGAHQLRPAALGPTDSRRLLEDRFGDTLRHEAERIVARAAGNPLALLELGAGANAGVEAATTVEQAYAVAIGGLPAETRTILLLAAADDPARVGTVAAAAPVLGADIAALEPAELAGLVTVGGEVIVFKHPLVRAAAYAAASFEQRRAAHSALAAAFERAEDADRRAWHRAAATVGLDEMVATELEQAAVRASVRTGYAAAANALERAARLSPHPVDRARRLVEAAASASLAGQRDRALALVDEADLAVAEPLVRVAAARTRGIIEAQCGSPREAANILLAAARDAYRLDRRAVLDLVTLAQEAAGLAGALDEVVDLGRWGEELGEGETTDERIMIGLVRGFAAISSGDRAAAAGPLSRAVELGSTVDDPRLLVWAGTAAMFLGDEGRVLELLQRAAREARARGALAVLPFALHLLAGAERRVGRVAAAEADADEALRLAREAGQEVVAAGALSTLTALAAFRGEVERAEALAAETRALAMPAHRVVALLGAERALAEVDLALGRAADAFERLSAVIDADSMRIHAPYTLFTTPLLVEAAVHSGRRGRAIALLNVFDEWATAAGTGWAPPIAARCRALLAADEAEADTWFQRALELHAAHPHAYETARTQLLYGEFLRRARRKTEARGQLRAALDAFESVGARLWADRALGELRATGATARKRDDSTRGDLTPQELQIVRLVAVGKTNPQVAAELFVSPKTVQYHLRKVFAKLAIASRAELTRLVAQGEIPGAAPSADAASPAAARLAGR